MDNNEINETLEAEEIRKALGLGYPEPEEKVSVLQFLKDIITQKLNIKTGNLTLQELGEAKIPVRTNLELASYCEFMGMDSFAKVFEEDAQRILATSLSRGGFLPILAVTTKKETSTSLQKVAAPAKEKRGFFRKKVDGSGV